MHTSPPKSPAPQLTQSRNATSTPDRSASTYRSSLAIGALVTVYTALALYALKNDRSAATPERPLPVRVTNVMREVRGAIESDTSDEPFLKPSGTPNLDVNRDGRVSPIDGLIPTNELNRTGDRRLHEGEGHLDTNGDGKLTAHDVLGVVNYMNERIESRQPVAQAED